jgi:DNA polymerase-3 subunit beta
MITIPCNVLHAASMFAATKDVRYYLNGVCIELVDARTYDVIATQGHCLFVSRQTLGEKDPDIHPSVPKQFIMGRSTLQPLVKKRGVLSIIQFGNDGWIEVEAIRNGHTLKSFVVKIEGKFVEWRKAVSAAINADRAEAMLSNNYIGLVQQAAEALDSRSPSVVFNGDGNAASTVAFSDKRSMALIMPLREHDHALPEWATRMAEEAKPKDDGAQALAM